jgi:DNA repair protein RecN (Recombination protein N)
MIKTLRISNFALIQQADISFESGFTVITGETGSGKSILLNALQLILGERANFKVIGNDGDKSVVESEIDISKYDLKAFFDTNELDYFETAIVRREIYKQGRSRAFINDIPVQLNVLKAFTSRLVHIHSQYNTLELKDRDYQLRLLDVLSGNLDERRQYNEAYITFKKDHQRLITLKESLHASEERSDYNSFQLEEIEALQLDTMDYDQLKAKLDASENAQVIREALGSVSAAIFEDNGWVDQIQGLLRSFSKGTETSAVLQEIKNRLESVKIELEDIGNEADNALEMDQLQPEDLVDLMAKMDAYNKVLFKHRFEGQSQLVAYRDELLQASDDIEAIRQECAALEAKVGRQEEELNIRAQKLHQLRLENAPKIAEHIKNVLEALKLADTLLDFELKLLEDIGPWGKTYVELQFSPNKGVEPVPIHMAASGGELSRVMLALQNVLSQKEQLQSVLFDEIDTGVSGDVAQKVGQLLKEMGQNMQVIAITHLPQVAAKGGQHLSVQKQVISGVTRTSIRELDMTERLEETARLMSGAKVNEAAIQNARALMES